MVMLAVDVKNLASHGGLTGLSQWHHSVAAPS